MQHPLMSPKVHIFIEHQLIFTKRSDNLKINKITHMKNKILRGLISFFIAVNFLGIRANASLLLEDINISQPEGPSLMVMRFFETPEEALQKCNEMAGSRINGSTGCYSVGGPAPDGSVSRYVGGWFGACTSSTCDLAPNGFLYLDFRACTFGYQFVGNDQYCTKETLISIKGANSTSPLPMGPSIIQMVQIKDTRGKIAGVSVKVDLYEDGILQTQIIGSTNAEGIYPFKYVPPLARRADITLRATCSECDNTDEKKISVSFNMIDDSQMCRRKQP